MKLILIVLFMLFLSPPAMADMFKKSGVGCVTEELYDEITTAAARGDERHFKHLMKNGCIMVREGIMVSILD